MRKRDRVGRIVTLVHNVNNNFGLFLKSEEVVLEQIKALGLDKEIYEVKWKYCIDFEIDKVCLKGKGVGGSLNV